MGIQKINKGRAQRIEWIDALKGFAILSVVLGHALLGYGEIMRLKHQLTIRFFP